MSDDSNNSPSRTRRSSFAGQTFADIFGTGRNSISRSNGNENSPPNSYPGPITTAAAQAQQRRRLSLTTLGLGNNNNNTQSSAFGGYRGRNDSLGSADNSIDECAVEDDVGTKDGPTPSTPFARRVSFGARAMMDIRNGSGSSPSQQNQNASGEGFNWSDNLRTRAERTSNAGLPATGPPVISSHQRAKSIAVVEPPIRESPREQKRPDHFQERILKGDFYMD